MRRVDLLRGSLGGRHCTSRLAGVTAAPGGRHVPPEPLPHAKQDRSQGASPGVRAYVTSGGPLVTTRAQRGAGAQRPHTTACGELKARGARAARRSRAHAPHVGGALGVGFGEWPATPALFCRRPAAQVVTLRAAGRRDGPRRTDGDARPRIEPRTDTAPLPPP